MSIPTVLTSLTIGMST